MVLDFLLVLSAEAMITSSSSAMDQPTKQAVQCPERVVRSVEDLPGGTENAQGFRVSRPQATDMPLADSVWSLNQHRRPCI